MTGAGLSDPSIRWLDRFSMNTEKILLALDTLSCALSDHNHIWTVEDRHVYESALRELDGEETNKRTTEEVVMFDTQLQKYLQQHIRNHEGLPFWSLELGIKGVLEQEGWSPPKNRPGHYIHDPRYAYGHLIIPWGKQWLSYFEDYGFRLTDKKYGFHNCTLSKIY